MTPVDWDNLFRLIRKLEDSDEATITILEEAENYNCKNDLANFVERFDGQLPD